MGAVLPAFDETSYESVEVDGKTYNYYKAVKGGETVGYAVKFMAQWEGFDPSAKILSVKKDGGDVDAITASTITSRAYTEAVKNAVNAVKAMED